MKSVVTAPNLKKIILLLLKREKNRLQWQQSVITKITKCLLIYLELIRHDQNKQKRIWVSEIFTELNRLSQGASDNLVKTLRLHDEACYTNFLRMPPKLFDKLLSLVGPRISKQHAVRSPLSPEIRLQLTLRYLATGDNLKSLSYLFRVSCSSITRIIEETSREIWNALKPLVFDSQFNEDTWKKISDDFNEEWNFPHCLGCVDSKLVNIEAPSHSGSFFYDYKGHHSLHLQAYADAYQKFIMVEIGSAGRQSDGGVFNHSESGQRLKNSELGIPQAEPLIAGGKKFPYVFLGDEAFALSNFLLRPYPRSSNLDLRKKVFNYRLSRARRIVEAAFGTLTSVWQIFRTTIRTSVPVTIEIIKACVCLHNFLIMHDQERKTKNMTPAAGNNAEKLQDLEVQPNCNTQRTVAAMREDFADYFMNEGAVPFQWDKAMNCDF